MRGRARALPAIAGAALAMGAGACGSAPAPRGDGVARSFRMIAPFSPGRFGSGAAPNPWLPLVAGTQWVRVGATDVGHRRVPHRVVSTVTGVRRRIAGVWAVAVLDQGIDSGQVAHESIDFLATDRAGSVWDLGSYAEAYEAGRFVSVRDAWLAGVAGARAGILMPGRPSLRTPPWLIAQPPGADPDVAQVVRTGVRHCVALRCFSGVLVVREGKASAPDNEFKFYAAGVGQIDNVPRSASAHHDVEQLVAVRRLTAAGLAEASAEALRLDRHARSTAPAVYRRGAPARR